MFLVSKNEGGGVSRSLSSFCARSLSLSLRGEKFGDYCWDAPARRTRRWTGFRRGEREERVRARTVFGNARGEDGGWVRERRVGVLHAFVVVVWSEGEVVERGLR